MRCDRRTIAREQVAWELAVTRSDLTRILIDDFPGIRVQDIEAAVLAFFETIGDQLQSGHRTELRGFGTFFVTDHAARSGISPSSGAPYRKEARRMPRFKASNTILRLINAK